MSLDRSSALRFQVKKPVKGWCTVGFSHHVTPELTNPNLTHMIFLPTKMRTLSCGCMFLMKSNT